MSSDIILKVENVGKQYRLGLVGTGTISHDLNRWWKKTLGKEDPYLKVGESNNRSEKGISDYVWAIKNINFEVKRGEVLGIIGKNGAGKSTLLKILSRVTGPSVGEIKTKGRIASLLEVGTGFHPEMTGRENIYLNGAILGMTKAEINSKIDEIIEFSGCLRYVDTPVKRYSSGMKVRLAFAVAAHLEPDILVVDEVLAVGDAEFQKKAIGKMQDISNSDGRTVLFVSHNMAAVKSLCTRCVVLENGKSVFEGETDAAVDFYLNNSGSNSSTYTGSIQFNKDEIGNQQVALVEVKSFDNNERVRSTFFNNEDISISIKVNVKESIKNSRFALIMETLNGEKVFVSASNEITKGDITKGLYTFSVVIPKNLLNNIEYNVFVSGAIPGKNYFFKPYKCFSVKIEDSKSKGYNFNEKWHGTVHPQLKWSLKT
ncbi:ABC transporter ATP-binding protein [uncultured Winogradskyella sp.]|uniref:ABC transporter ATP-binding protein n=1 Tax=uncultured Winogradskyella sp. TaxID=395353 RepID=UPI00261AD9EE|nr:ABC transporter ATP-binding protein [uncultured Winogradskyella sp.]|tara:strand:+ start:8170 stop:9456 length:1287 start_codon:yes stop_codon:yes gene_type:complete